MNVNRPTPADSASAPLLILAPGRDGELSHKIVRDAGLACLLCRDEGDLLERLAGPHGAVLLSEETLSEPLVASIRSYIINQPAWSDIPILIVAQQERRPRIKELQALGNISILTRPMAPESLASSVAAALRARQRQFEVRDLLQLQAEQARRKDEFLAMLAHELRNPLAPIRYAAHALQLPGLPVAKLAGMATLVERQVSHMSRIIDQLLDLTRVTRGVVQLNRHALNLTDLVAASIDAHADAASLRGITLHGEAAGPVWVNGDGTRLKQVLDNLIDNAIKFSREQGSVRVELGPSGQDAVLKVVDQGEGIDSQSLPFLFEPFMQADRSLDRSRGGLGLGLALVKGLIQLHGGSVTAWSAGPGQGSTFTVSLALLDTGLVDVAAVNPQDMRPARTLHVLVAEDNVDAAETLRMILEVWGYQVSVAHSGPAAIETARRLRPEVVVCDIGLPGASGYEVARILRAEPDHQGALLIAVTGYGGDQNRQAALSAGFDAHFAKPVSPAELLEQLSKRAQSLEARSGADPKTRVSTPAIRH